MDSKKNTAWFFGDSFTINSALIHPGEYTDYLGYMPETWTTLISKYLGCNEMVIAKGGQSTQKTISEVYEYFSKMKSGDYCFIGQSPSIRYEGVNIETKNVSTYNNEVFFSFEDISNVTEIPDYIFKTDTFTYNLPIEKKISHILLDYVLHFIQPYESEWDEYWKTQVVHQIRNLDVIGVTGIHHSNKVWGNFTSMHDETNGIINDSHWGKEGNMEFYLHLVDRIKKNQYIE